MSPEDRASKVMAECVAKNGGENVAFYLAKALHEHGDERYAAGLEAAAEIAEAIDSGRSNEKEIAKAIRALGKEGT